MFLSAASHEGGMAPGIAFHIPIAGYDIPIYNFVITSWIIMLLLVLIGVMGTRNAKKVPAGVQNVAEYIVEGLVGFLSGILGENRARKYLPLLGTFFLFIILSNYSGLIPGMGSVKGMQAPSSTFNVTAALAIIVFFATHVLGIQAKGIGYFKHFFTPLWWLFALNLLDEVVRPVSLSLRLYGNIYGEETIIHQLGSMVPLLVPLPIMVLSLLLGAIQALVFTLLASNYIGDATEQHH